MAKDLPYFQFEPSEYLAGDISICSLESQGVFINLCCLYWQKECELGLSKALRRFKQGLIQELIDEDVIKVDEDQIVISFLDDQYNTISERKKKLSEAGRKGGKVSKPKPPLSDTKATPKHLEKRREEDSKEEEIKKYNNTSIKMKPKASPLHQDLKKDFLEYYLDQTGNEFFWTAKEATNLKQLISKLTFSIEEKKEKSSAKKEKATDEEIISSFRIILENLPQWIKEKTFTVAGINSQYMNILNGIKNGQSKQISNEPTDEQIRAKWARILGEE